MARKKKAPLKSSESGADVEDVKVKGELEVDEKPKAKAKADDTEKVENWADERDPDLYDKCSKMYEQIVKAYKNREGADDDIAEYWSIFNAQLDDNQFYVGNSKCYIPVVRDAVGARAKRALKQLFPNKYKHVEAVGSDSQVPKAQVALLEQYIRTTKLKSICRSMLIAGDVTGQWNLYIDWSSTTRNVTGIVKRNPIIEDVEGSELEAVDPTDKVEETTDEEVTHAGPQIVDFATEDLVVIPPTATIATADITCLKLRMSKEQVQEMIDNGTFVIDLDDAESDLAGWMSDRKGQEKQVPDKERASDAGVKTEGTFKYALIYWAQVYLEFEEGKKSLADVYFAGDNEVIGIVKAPQWGQKRSILSAPVERIAGSFNGVSKIEPVKRLQWSLNDFWNMGEDSAMYSLMPIVMTDPAKNPNYAMMVLGLAAVWPVDPNSTKFQSFPPLWKDAAQKCEQIKAQIHESLDVNPMMMGQMPKGRKNAPAMGAQQQEQSVSIMDHAERFEEEILNPLMELMYEYDAQFRDEPLSVVTRGDLGVRASITDIPVNAWGERFFFQWTGTDFVMNMQRMQQQIATMNVLRGVPPQQLQGYRVDVAPILERLVENVFGSELGSRILIDERNKYSVAPEVEDEMMHNGILVEVHEGDDDMHHIQSHQKAAMATGDEHGMFRTHLKAHMQALQKKRQAALPPPPQQGAPGMPGGAGPGVPGAPRMGAQPAPQRPMQQPPGAIPQGSAG